MVEAEEFTLVALVVQYVIDMGMNCIFPIRNFEEYTHLM